MNLDFARALIEDPNEATLRSLFKEPHPGIFWVDWREADDYIVVLAARAIERSDLQARWQDDVLTIAFGGRTTPVPLEQKPGEQDITLAALNRALDPDFELRWIRASDGGDTLAFQILAANDWQALDVQYGATVAQAFARLDPARPLFGDEVAAQPTDDMRASVAVSIGVASPQQRDSLASARIRLIAARADDAELDSTGTVSEVLAGDLRVVFEIDEDSATRLVTESDLLVAGIDRTTLSQWAVSHCEPFWHQMRDSGNAQLSRLHVQGKVDTSSVALHRGLWNSLTADGHRLVVAFPRRDLVLMCNDGATAIAALVEMLEGFDPADPRTLSRLIYVWRGEGWAVRELQVSEKGFRSSPLWLAAERGEVQAQFSLAHLYDVSTHYAEALRRYQRIAEQVKAKRVDSSDMFENGSAALCNLADKYEHGTGVAQDLKLARQWYMRSAAMGNCVAQFSLGMMYAAGRGVPVDPELAITWLQQSAQQGYTPAQDQLRIIRQVLGGGTTLP